MKDFTRYPVVVFIVASIQRTIFAGDMSPTGGWCCRIKASQSGKLNSVYVGSYFLLPAKSFPEPLCRYSLLNGEAGHLPDSAFSSSTSRIPVSPHDDHYPARARMDSKFDTGRTAAWRAETLEEDQFVQVDLGTESLINGIGTAGCGSSGTIKPCNEYVTKYRIQHSLDRNTWITVKEGIGDTVFIGNSQPYDTVMHDLNCTVVTRFVRIIPLEWHNWITLKFDVQGCKVQRGSATIMSLDQLHKVPTNFRPVANTGATPSSHLTISSNKRPSDSKDCIGGFGNMSCWGKADGDYQHCASCKKYINCTGNKLTEFTCPSQLVWDNSAKQCITVSSTCR